MAPAAKISRFDRRKQEILDAAGALFNRHGLRDATLAVVAAEIGLNLKSLRYYYQRKEDLVAAAFTHSIALHRALADAAMAEPDVAGRVRRFIGGYLDLTARVRRGEQTQFVHFGDLRALTEPHSDVVFPEYIDLFRQMRTLLTDPARPLDRPVLNARTHYFVSQLLWAVVWLSNHPLDDFDRIADRFTDILLHGLAPDKDMPEMHPAEVAREGGDGERLSRDSFLRAATELINANGYRGASVDRISAALSVTKGAFYHHNDTKDDLVVACFERTFEILRQAQNTAIAANATGLARLGAATVALAEYQMRPEGTLLRTAALTAVEEHLREQMTLRMDRQTARFQDMLSDGAADGSARACDQRIASQMVTATINSTEELPRWVPSADAENVVALYVRPLFLGLLTPG